LFTWATVPLTKNYHDTPVVDSTDGHGSVFHPNTATGTSRSARLGRQLDRRARQEAGFEDVYYADQTTLSVWSPR
jgi:hypothetical protein